MNIKKYLLLVLILVTFLTGCQQISNKDVVDSPPTVLQVVTTFAPLTSMTKNIVGDKAEVYNLVPTGVSVHVWEPKPSDVKRVAGADLIVTNGLGLEEFLDDLLANTQNPDVAVIDTSEGVQTLKFENLIEPLENEHDEDHGEEEHGHEEDDEEEHHEHNHEGADPHIWLSPVNAQVQVKNILAGLTDADPANADYYQANAERYLAELEQLDKSIRETFLGKKLTNFVVFHDAYQYFLRNYNLLDGFHGAIETFPGKEPSPIYLQALTDLIVSEDIKVIFTEPQFSPTLIDRLREEYNLNSKEIDPIGLGTEANSYVENMEKLRSAFESLIVEQ